MPDGTTEPDQAAADLDQWCLRQLEENHGARYNARHDGIEDRMVSANLPEHTSVTEITSLTRTAAYPGQARQRATEAEQDTYQTRKKALMAKLSPVIPTCRRDDARVDASLAALVSSSGLRSLRQTRRAEAPFVAQSEINSTLGNPPRPGTRPAP